jgi:hypothetical protein
MKKNEMLQAGEMRNAYKVLVMKTRRKIQRKHMCMEVKGSGHDLCNILSLHLSG